MKLFAGADDRAAERSRYNDLECELMVVSALRFGRADAFCDHLRFKRAMPPEAEVIL
jgi:hypothetical protein